MITSRFFLNVAVFVVLIHPAFAQAQQASIVTSPPGTTFTYATSVNYSITGPTIYPQSYNWQF